MAVGSAHGAEAIGEKLYSFEGGDTDIIEMVQQEIGLGRGDVEEIDSDDEPEAVTSQRGNKNVSDS